MTANLLDLQPRRGHKLVPRELVDNVGVPHHVGGHHGVLAQSENRVDVRLTDLRMTHIGADRSKNTEKAQLQ